METATEQEIKPNPALAAEMEKMRREYKRLICRMAGNIASGLCASTNNTISVETGADTAVRLAVAIVKRVEAL